MTQSSISVVIPAFNEEDNLDFVLGHTTDILKSRGGDYEVIVTDDDSTDTTREIVRAWSGKDPNVRLLAIGANIGANAAAQRGMVAARGDVLFLMPADRQILADQIATCLPALDRSDYVCTRRVPRADPLHRRLMAGAYNAALRVMFRLPVHDVDSSILIRKEVVNAVVPQLRSRSDFLPAEMLIRARALGYRITEVDIEHHPRVAGKPASIRPLAVMATLLSMARFLGELKRIDRTMRRRADVRNRSGAPDDTARRSPEG